MVEIVIIFKDTFLLQGEDGITIPKDDSPLQPGDYFIESPAVIFHMSVTRISAKFAKIHRFL
jgi:hypothetical protein